MYAESPLSANGRNRHNENELYAESPLSANGRKRTFDLHFHRRKIHLEIVDVLKKHQKPSMLLWLSCIMVLSLFQESEAILSVKLVVNPDRTIVPVESEPIALTAKASGSNLQFNWELLGPGKLEGFMTGPAVFYIPPEKIDGKSAAVIIRLKVTDNEGQELTESVTLEIVSDGTDVPEIPPDFSPTPGPQPVTKEEDRLGQLKLKVCKERLPQLHEHTLCQHYEKYNELRKSEQPGNNTRNQRMLIFQDIVENLEEIKACVDTIIHKEPDDPSKDFLPRLKKILDRSENLESHQQPLVLGDFTFIPLNCQSLASIDRQRPGIDSIWKAKDAYKGPKTSRYKAPTQILADGEGNLYVLDRSLKRIFKFDSEGNHLSSHFDTIIVEEPWIPSSMALGNDTTLWVYYSWQREGKRSPPLAGRIRIYTRDGAPAPGWNEKKELTSCGEISFPLKGLIALDSENTLILVDQESGIMTKCDRQGKLLDQWGDHELITLRGKEELINRFEIVTNPQGLAVDIWGSIYVSNTAGHGIQRYYPDGEWIPGWPNVKGSDVYFFNSPHGLGIDEKNSIYVSDTNNHRIKKYSSGGKELLWFLGKNNAKKGKKYGEFNTPMDVAVNSDGTIIYVADTGNKRVQKFLIQQSEEGGK